MLLFINCEIASTIPHWRSVLSRNDRGKLRSLFSIDYLRCMRIKPGKYRHYKGKEYEVTGTARHSETLEELVVYRALYVNDDGEYGSLWVRPAGMFAEMVVIDGKEVKRFEFLGES